MRTKILNFFKYNRNWDEAVRLYNEFGQIQSFKQILNIHGENENTKPQLYEELRQLSGIDKLELDHILAQPLSSTPNINDTVEVKLIDLPEEIKSVIKLREEFPFLNNADCPNELKIMVADRISAYNAYVEAHQLLFAATSDEELHAVAETVVENYIENKEIWKELNYYKENGTVLGEYKMFEWKLREEEIRNMTPAELVKLRDNLKINIFKTNKLVEKEPLHKNIEERKISLKKKTKELLLVNQLLGIKDDTTPVPEVEVPNVEVPPVPEAEVPSEEVPPVI